MKFQPEPQAANSLLKLKDIALNSVREAAYLLDHGARIIYVNEEASRALGYSIEELLAMRVMDVDPDWSFERWADSEEAFKATGGTLTIDTVHRRKDGSLFPVEVTTARFEAEGVTYGLCLVRDVTERKRQEQRALVQEREFRTLANNLPDNVIRYDMHGLVTYINPALEKTLGRGPEELIGAPLRAPAPVGEEYFLAVESVLAGGGPAELEATLPVPHGPPEIHLIRVIPERGPNGVLTGALVIGRNITEKKRMEQALAASERNYRSLAESSPDNLIRYDREHRIRYVNTNLARQLGLRHPEDVLGKRPIEVWKDNRYVVIDAAAAHAAETGRRTTVQVNERASDGTTRHHQIVVVPERNTEGKLIGTLAFGRDVTEIREAESRLRHFVDSIPGFAFTFRLTRQQKGSFPYASAGIRKFYGLAPEAVGDDYRPILDLMHSDDQPRIKAAVLESAASLTPFHIESRICRPGFPIRWQDVQAVPERQADGSVLWYGIMLDITERKRAELDVQDREEQLRESNAQLRELTMHRETAREEERKRIAREIHDELGQILTALRMGISRLRFQFGAAHPELAEPIEDMQQIAAQALQSVRDIAGALRPASLDAGIAPALSWLALEFRNRTKIPCRLNLPKTAIALDEERALGLFRIAQESLTNVARHAEATEVNLALAIRDGHCTIEIRDNGKGFAPATGPARSFGVIGMHERAQMAGGTLHIESNPGCGTTVTARVPMDDKRNHP